MTQRIGPKDENDKRTDKQIRDELDNGLGVVRWITPGGGTAPEPDEQEEGAPLWWAGEEEASQSFLGSMGVIL